MTFKRIVPVAAALALAGCGLLPQEEKVEVVAITQEAPKPPMPEVCHAEKLNKFRPVKKEPGGTDAKAVVHALQSNKTRMAANEARVLACECQRAEETKNPEDLKRLEGKCNPSEKVS